ncbi:MAG: hypothetical protein QOG85_2674 [Gaiellaceae bacterium]|jgi:hypothetical protein|nr:hypothetical protein [Gaiellaceae bacterium]
MSRRATLTVFAAAVVGAWILCWWVYHANGGGSYGWFYVVVPIAVGLLTIGSAGAIVSAWRRNGGTLLAGLLSGITVAGTLLLALALYARGA